MGPVGESDLFRPERLTPVLLQLRFRNELTPTASATSKIRAMARINPLPYLGLVLDIGAEKAKTLIEISCPWVPLTDMDSCQLKLSQAQLNVRRCQERVSNVQYGDEPGAVLNQEKLKQQKKLLLDARKETVLASQEIDACGRYVIHIRTTEPFRSMLQRVEGLQDSFEAFVEAAKPPDFSSHNDPEVQSFLPWDCLLGCDAGDSPGRLLGKEMNIQFQDNEEMNVD